MIELNGMLPAWLLPGLAVAFPLAGSLVVFGAGRWRRRAAGLAAAGTVAIITLVLTVLMVVKVADGNRIDLVVFQFLPPWPVAFRVDAMGALFAATVAGLFLLAMTHAVGYLPDDRRQWRFHGFLLASLGCMIGVALAANLLTLLLFYELFSLLAYPLIVHERKPEAFSAALKYLAYILSGGALVFTGILLVQHIAGSGTFVAGGLLSEGAADVSLDSSHDHLPDHLVIVAWAALMTGFGVKAALMPLHGWVPDVHPAAPSPFSGILSGVMVAAGVFGILRVLFEIFGAGLLQRLGVLPWLAAFAGFAVIAGAMRAVAEDDLKRRLAYSTISQMAYVSLAASLASQTALAGALVHIVHHAFFKGGLFLCAGLIIAMTGVRRVSRMRGLGRRMPWTASTLTLLALAMIGVPPLSGFTGKWVLGTGMAQAGGYAHLAVMLAGSLLAALYLWPVIYRIWQRAADGSPEAGLDAGGGADGKSRADAGWMLAAVVATGLITILLGVAPRLPGFPLELAETAARSLLGTSAWK